MPVFYNEEIASSIIKVSNSNKHVCWLDLLGVMIVFIAGTYDVRNMNINDFRGDWKKRIKHTVNDMGYTISGNDEFQQGWTLVKDYLQNTTDRESIKSKSTSTKSTKSSSTTSSDKITNDDKIKVLALYSSIPSDQKWILSTGTIVDDQMMKLVEESAYEHPAHSLILDPEDHIWKKYFTREELREINQFRAKSLGDLPSELQEYLDLYDREWTDPLELYQFADDQKHHPLTAFDKKWVRESVIHATELFLNGGLLRLDDYSEADLLRIFYHSL